MQHRHIFFTKRLASLEIELSAETEMQGKKVVKVPEGSNIRIVQKNGS